MSDEAIVYEYTAADGVRLPAGVPARSLTARDIERMTPDQRREVKALAQFRPANKSAAARTVNQIRKDEVKDAERAAAAADGGEA